METRANKPVKHGFDHSRFGQDPASLAIDSTATASTTAFDQGVHSDGATLGQALLADGADGSDWGDVVFSPAAVSYTPALTASGSNPNKGVGGSTAGSYIHIGDIVFVWGSVAFLSGGVAAGTGDWEISLPVAITGGADYVSAAAHFETDPVHTKLWTLDVRAQGSTFKLVYSDAYPVGNYTVLDSASLSGSPWTLASGDVLVFQFAYLV